jgi:hypothetical protein
MTHFGYQKAPKSYIEKEGKKLYRLSGPKRRVYWRGQLVDKNARCHAA